MADTKELVDRIRSALGPRVPAKHASYLERVRNETIDALDELEFRLDRALSQPQVVRAETAERAMVEHMKMREAAERERDEWKQHHQEVSVYAEKCVDENVALEARVAELEEALREIADYGHEMDDYVLPPKQARKIARAALDREKGGE